MPNHSGCCYAHVTSLQAGHDFHEGVRARKKELLRKLFHTFGLGVYHCAVVDVVGALVSRFHKRLITF